MRGNQGWSTAGRAGRPALPEGEKKKPRCLKANEAEWELIKKFEKLAKADIAKARKILDAP